MVPKKRTQSGTKCVFSVCLDYIPSGYEKEYL